MILSDTAIKRPVLTIVGALIVVLIGALAFSRLPVREYPDTDVPTVSVTTTYRGASAEVVESRVTEPLEEQLSAIDGIRVLKSSSQEEVSRITIEFNLERDPDEAANDVRDRVDRARDRLPEEIDQPLIAKEEADAAPELWLTFTSNRHSRSELTDMVDRIAKQRIQTVPGVGTIFIGGERRFAMRVWLDPERLAAHQLTADDVALALRNFRSPALPTDLAVAVSSGKNKRVSSEVIGRMRTASSTGSPASRRSTKFVPFTVRPSLISRHGIILLVSITG